MDPVSALDGTRHGLLTCLPLPSQLPKEIAISQEGTEHDDRGRAAAAVEAGRLPAPKRFVAFSDDSSGPG